MTGTISIKNAKTYTYKLAFNIQGTAIKGYATTVLLDGTESKAAITGEINKDEETLSFAETPYDAQQKNPIFCFITATLHYALKDRQYIISGAFKGIDNSGMYCAEGNITLNMTAKGERFFPQSDKGANHPEKNLTGTKTIQSVSREQPHVGGLQNTATRELTKKTEAKKIEGEHPDPVPNKQIIEQVLTNKYPTAAHYDNVPTDVKGTIGEERKTGTSEHKQTVGAASGNHESTLQSYKAINDHISPSVPGKAGSLPRAHVKKAEESTGPVEAQDTTDELEEYSITAGIKKVFYWTTDTCLIELYDGGVIDGDIVTVYLNGEEILTKYMLAKKKKQMKLFLKQDVNSIEIVAENLGKTPPNTSNMILADGKRQYRLRAYNDIGETAEIILKKKKLPGKQHP